MASKKWEDMCKRCGLCCHEKIIYDDEIVFDLSSPCEHLNTETNLCSIYNDRFKKCGRCQKVNIFRAMFASYLPLSCAYVMWAKEHHLRFVKEKSEVFTFDNSLSLDDDEVNR